MLSLRMKIFSRTDRRKESRQSQKILNVYQWVTSGYGGDVDSYEMDLI